MGSPNYWGFLDSGGRIRIGGIRIWHKHLDLNFSSFWSEVSRHLLDLFILLSYSKNLFFCTFFSKSTFGRRVLRICSTDLYVVRWGLQLFTLVRWVTRPIAAFASVHWVEEEYSVMYGGMFTSDAVASNVPKTGHPDSPASNVLTTARRALLSSSLPWASTREVLQTGKPNNWDPCFSTQVRARTWRPTSSPLKQRLAPVSTIGLLVLDVAFQPFT